LSLSGSDGMLKDKAITAKDNATLENIFDPELGVKPAHLSVPRSSRPRIF
jgi:hypothetical protein